MPFTLTMPKMSPTMETGAIAKWHKKEGEHVEAGELIIEVATDKATVEYNALDSGWVRKILVPEGQEAQVNQAIAILTEQQDESIEGYTPEGETAASFEPQQSGDEEKLEKEAKPSEKPAAPKPARKEGLSQPAFVPEPPLQTAIPSFAPPASGTGRVLASPLARKLAEEKGVDLSSVKGSGPNGRIMKRDLEQAQPKAALGSRGQPQYPPGFYEEEAQSQMRKVIGQRLQEAKTFIPHFYVSMEIDADNILSLREQLSHGQVKITYNDMVTRAAALALVKHPNVNSGFNSTSNSLVHFKTVDISIAVSLPEGLITPIIRYADYKSILEISVEIRQLAKRAKEGKLDLHEFKGGSFTISNLGMYGVDDFMAIINPPQAAILAVSGIQEKPVVKKGRIVPGNVMRLTLSADHRVIDGVAGAEFLKTLKQYLESPALLLL